MTINPPRLVVFSGPPGVGKSSLSYRLAQHTGWAVLAKDQIDRTFERAYTSDYPAILAYEVMLDLAALNLRNGASIILDAVFGRQEMRQHALDLAKDVRAEFRAIVCTCSDSALWQQRIERRPAIIEGWTPMNWAGALASASRYEPWPEPHLALDAVEPFETNVATLLSYVLA